MWHDHLFSQRNKATKRAVVLEGEGGVGQNLTKGGLCNIRCLHKIGALGTPYQLWSK